MTQEKIKLEKSTYDTVKSMLESSDKENMILAFECIKNADFKTNIIYILMLYKEVNLDQNIWVEHVPNVSKVITELVPEHPFVSYKKLLDIAIEYKVPQEDVDFYADRYALFLQERDEVESVEIRIKLKKYESN